MSTSLARSKTVAGLCWLMVVIATGIHPATAQSLGSPSNFLSPIPIERLWWIAAEAVTQRNFTVVQSAIAQWRDAGTFDAFSIGLLPPTFVDLDSSIILANKLHEQVPGRLIVGMFPTGTEGWETSFNRQFAQRLEQLGITYDSTKAMAREAWLNSLQAVEAATWAYVLEQPARRPTEPEVVASVGAFVQRTRELNKGAVLWLSVMMLRQPVDLAIARRILTAVGNQVDAVVWMDLPIVSQDSGRTLEGLLDTILTVTPVQKVMIQWTHNPNLITKDTAGTLEYIAKCQARGINRFVLLANPWLLQQEPWATFYRNLRKTTSVGENAQPFHGFTLYPNSPNPFNSSTTIRFLLPKRSHVTLKVFDVLGREVATLVDEELNPGEHSINFDATDLPNGIYLYQLSTDNFVQVHKTELIK